MQKSNGNTVKSAHRRVKSSTTLNRRYVKHPRKTTGPAADTAEKISVPVRRVQLSEKPSAQSTIHPSVELPVQPPVNQPSLTAKEIKDRAIKKALADASSTKTSSTQSSNKRHHKKSSPQVHFGFGRVALALVCATIVVFAIVYFANLNMPDVSLRVAAMQTGINASYPSYVPRDFSVSSITSEENKVTIEFSNPNTGDAFTLMEESSSWDSNALMTNYVKEKFSDDYSIIREQGITIYINNSNAAWVNGGIVYKINTTSGSLTNKQIKSIATSL